MANCLGHKLAKCLEDNGYYNREIDDSLYDWLVKDLFCFRWWSTTQIATNWSSTCFVSPAGVASVLYHLTRKLQIVGKRVNTTWMHPNCHHSAVYGWKITPLGIPFAQLHPTIVLLYYITSRKTGKRIGLYSLTLSALRWKKFLIQSLTSPTSARVRGSLIFNIALISFTHCITTCTFAFDSHFYTLI